MNKLSIIIPVYNEPDTINDLIMHIKTIMNNNNYEIIIVDAQNNKSTLKKIKDNTVIKLVSEKGRALQMNTGAESASGEILLFLHADTFLPENAYNFINQALINNIVAGAFNLGLNNKKFIYRIMEIIVKYRTKVSRVPFGDQAIFIKKDYFFEIGKYKKIPFLEDVELMKRIRKNKNKICIISAKVLSSTRKWENDGIWYNTFRNTLIQILYSIGVSPHRLIKFYYKD